MSGMNSVTITLTEQERMLVEFIIAQEAVEARRSAIKAEARGDVDFGEMFRDKYRILRAVVDRLEAALVA
jgi:hypothetical protein